MRRLTSILAAAVLLAGCGGTDTGEPKQDAQEQTVRVAVDAPDTDLIFSEDTVRIMHRMNEYTYMKRDAMNGISLTADYWQEDNGAGKTRAAALMASSAEDIRHTFALCREAKRRNIKVTEDDRGVIAEMVSKVYDQADAVKKNELLRYLQACDVRVTEDVLTDIFEYTVLAARVTEAMEAEEPAREPIRNGVRVHELTLSVKPQDNETPEDALRGSLAVAKKMREEVLAGEPMTEVAARYGAALAPAEYCDRNESEFPNRRSYIDALYQTAVDDVPEVFEIKDGDEGPVRELIIAKVTEANTSGLAEKMQQTYDEKAVREAVKTKIRTSMENVRLEKTFFEGLQPVFHEIIKK